LIEYNTQHIKVQLIILENIPKTMNILNKFDFDFCKVTFDGTEFTISDEAKNKKGNYVLPFVPSMLVHFRLIKYEKRGFSVLNRDKFIPKSKKSLK
jgi:hypothetical protein